MSISRDQLIQFIEKPGNMKEPAIAGLKEIIDEFPFFQSAQLLYTANLSAQASFRFASYLKTCSIYATDRSVLYSLLQPQKKEESREIKQPKTLDIQDPEDNQLFELADEGPVTTADFPIISSSDSELNDVFGYDLLSFDQPEFPFTLDHEPEQPVNDIVTEVQTIDHNSPKIDLIDQFIKSAPSMQPAADTLSDKSRESMVRDEHDNESDEFITETLSRIYLKQGHYQKAIESFQRLSLKFPEKSIYFAQQIEEIKKLIN